MKIQNSDENKVTTKRSDKQHSELIESLDNIGYTIQGLNRTLQDIFFGGNQTVNINLPDDVLGYFKCLKKQADNKR